MRSVAAQALRWGCVGATRHFDAGAPFDNGTLGRGALTHKRLLACPSFGEVELSEADVIAAAQDREAKRIDAIPDPVESDEPRHKGHYSIKELGILVADARDGVSIEDTAAKLGRQAHSVHAELVLIRKWVGAKGRHETARKRLPGAAP